jgi:hypothetical protein
MIWLYLYLCFIASCLFHANTQLQMTIVILLSSGKNSLKWCPSATGVCILIHPHLYISMCLDLWPRRKTWSISKSVKYHGAHMQVDQFKHPSGLDLSSTSVAYHIFPLSDGNSLCLQISRGKHFPRICLHPTRHLLSPTHFFLPRITLSLSLSGFMLGCFRI